MNPEELGGSLRLAGAATVEPKNATQTNEGIKAKSARMGWRIGSDF